MLKYFFIPIFRTTFAHHLKEYSLCFLAFDPVREILQGNFFAKNLRNTKKCSIFVVFKKHDFLWTKLF